VKAAVEDERRLQGHAYVGGVLATLDHLGLVNADEQVEWSRRISGALETPPAG
jgi:hypothetical protein